MVNECVRLLSVRRAPRRASDEEDVALSAFQSFYQGIARGRFPQLEDRDNLWRLLITITARKRRLMPTASAARSGTPDA